MAMRSNIHGVQSSIHRVLYLLLACGITAVMCNHTHSNHTHYMGLPISAERRLVNALMEDYKKLGTISRPVINTSAPVDVEFGLGLIQMDLVEKDNIMFMSAWTRYQWCDDYLRWDPNDYEGIESIKLPSSLIWNPDIMLYNTASTTVYTRTALAVVTHDGVVTWFPHRVFESSCSINVRYFPFDNQTCHMFFGSWTHTVREINVSLAFPMGIDLSTLDLEYNASSKWEIMSVEASRKAPDEDYALLSFRICLKRKMMFSSYILTVPAVFLSFLTLVVFSLPTEDVEKSQLGLAIFGALLLLLLIVVEAAPPTASAVPLLGVFYCFTTVIVILSVFLTALVVKIGNVGVGGKVRPVPKVLKTIVFKGIGTIFCAQPRRMVRKRQLATEFHDSPLTANGYPSHSHVHTSSLKSRVADIDNSNSCNSCYTMCEQLHRQLQSLLATVTSMSKRQEDKQIKQDWEKSCEYEWRRVAALLDRLFFWIYLIIIIMSVIFLFPWW